LLAFAFARGWWPAAPWVRTGLRARPHVALASSRFVVGGRSWPGAAGLPFWAAVRRGPDFYQVAPAVQPVTWADHLGTGDRFGGPKGL